MQPPACLPDSKHAVMTDCSCQVKYSPPRLAPTEMKGSRRLGGVQPGKGAVCLAPAGHIIGCVTSLLHGQRPQGRRGLAAGDAILHLYTVSCGVYTGQACFHKSVDFYTRSRIASSLPRQAGIGNDTLGYQCQAGG